MQISDQETSVSAPPSKKISMVIPAFDEVQNLEIVVDRARRVLQELTNDGDYEIVIVDDGSRDGTGELAMRLASEDPHLVVKQHAMNRGIGAALSTGYEAASKSLVCYFPADGQVPPESLRTLMPLLDQADLLTTTYHHRSDHPIRLLQSRVERALIRLLFPGAPDIRGIPRLFRRDVLDDIQLTSSTGLANFELLMQAAKKRFRIVNVEIECQPRLSGRSKVNNLRYIFRVLLGMLKLRLRRP